MYERSSPNYLTPFLCMYERCSTIYACRFVSSKDDGIGDGVCVYSIDVVGLTDYEIQEKFVSLRFVLVYVLLNQALWHSLCSLSFLQNYRPVFVFAWFLLRLVSFKNIVCFLCSLGFLKIIVCHELNAALRIV